MKLRIRHYIFSFLAFIISINASAQISLSLDSCRKAAAKMTPLVRQQAWIAVQNKEYQSSLKTGYLPQLNITGQASYQSDVTSLSITLPDINIQPLSKDQYSTVLTIDQTIWDGGVIASQRAVRQSEEAIASQQCEVSIYNLKDKINDYFIAAMLIERQLEVVQLQIQTLQKNIQTLQAMVNNGAILQSDLDKFVVQKLQAEQQQVKLQYNKLSYLESMAILTEFDIPTDVTLMVPDTSYILPQHSIRPEFKLYDYQITNVDYQAKLSLHTDMPKISLFGDGGYGRPGLNMLKNSFDWYYMVGVRLQVPITSWLTGKFDRKALAAQVGIISASRDDYDRNLQVDISNQECAIAQAVAVLQRDDEIISKQQRIREESFAQLSNGAINTVDYITELNNEMQARSMQKYHQMELIQAKVKLASLYGLY